MNAEKAIQTASRLYEARRASKTVLSDQWRPLMTMLAGHLRTIMKVHRCNEVQAGILMCEQVYEKGGIPSHSVHILSAAVEMVEPSTP